MPSEENGRDSDPELPAHVTEASGVGRPAPSPTAAARPSGVRTADGEETWSAGTATATSAVPPPMSSPSPGEPVALGAVRNAITAIHNLRSLLSSRRVGTKALAEVLDEFLASLSVLRGAFLSSAETAKDEEALAARATLSGFACARLDELGGAIQAAMATSFDARGRLGLEQIVNRVSGDLDASADLLDLSDRAERPVVTELVLAELARATLRGETHAGARQLQVRLEIGEEDAFLRVDPHLLKRIVAYAVARLHAGGAADVTLHTRLIDLRTRDPSSSGTLSPRSAPRGALGSRRSWFASPPASPRPTPSWRPPRGARRSR